jgi:hypothetical protein
LRPILDECGRKNARYLRLLWPSWHTLARDSHEELPPLVDGFFNKPAQLSHRTGGVSALNLGFCAEGLYRKPN